MKLNQLSFAAFIFMLCTLPGLNLNAQIGNTCIDSSRIDHSRPCPALVAPVCGCNGVTYPNSCVAEYYYGVTSWTQGACPSSPECHAGFTYVNNSPSLEVAFTNTSASNEKIKSYAWNFGNGKSSTAKNPKHTYKKAGTYYVCLDISTDNGCTSIYCDSVHVAIVGCEASFEDCFLPVPGMLPAPGLYVEFTNTSGGFYNQWSWTFGDGDTSTQQNPTHDYLFDAQPLYYLVCLTVSGPAPCKSTGCDTLFTNKIQECPLNGCINPNLIWPTALCSDQYDPVCGCNGITYQNACIAEIKNGVSNWLYGPCPGSGVAPGASETAGKQSTTTAAGGLENNVALNIYPNPTTGVTHIVYTLPAETDVEIQVLDVLGNVVATLFKGNQQSGQQTLSWNSGTAAPGIYLVSFRQNEKLLIQRISVMR